MTNLFYLLKLNSLNYTGINKILKSENKSERYKALAITFTIIFAMGLFILSGYMSSMEIAKILSPIGMVEIILINAALTSVLLCLFISAYNAQGILFSHKDYELLAPLPIKPSTILANKIIWLLLFNYVFEFFTLLPQAIAYFNIVNTSPLFFLYLFVGFLLLPLIPAIIASMLAFMLSYFSSKFKHSNLIIIVLSFLLFLGIMFGSLMFSDILNSIIANSESIILGIKKVYPPAYYFSKALSTLNIIDLVIFIIISLIPFIIFIIIFNKSFKTLTSKLGESYKSSNYKLGELKTSSQVHALFNKELKRYFSSYSYVLNTLFGMVLLCLMAIASLFISVETLQNTVGIPLSTGALPAMVTAITCGSVFLSNTTSSSISLEGKNLWILKSSPLKEVDIFKSKMTVNLFITIPLAIFSAILFTFGFNLTIVQLLWIITLSTLSALLNSMVGLIVNLYLPKLDFTSDTQVVKQGASTIISMLISFIIMSMPIFAFIKLEIADLNMFFTALTLILLTLSIILWTFLKTTGIRLFKKLN